MAPNTNTEDQKKNPRDYVRVETVRRLFGKGDFHDSGTRLSLRSYAEDPLAGFPPWPPQAQR